MRSRLLVAAPLLALLEAVGCGRPAPTPGTPPKTFAATSVPLRDEIPPDHLVAVLEANRLGIGLLEQFRYAEAAEQFRMVRKLAPGWVAGSINLSIALLNDSGVKSEAEKKGGADEGAVSGNFGEALGLLDDVIRRDPKNLHAHYCRGLILQYLMADPDHPEFLRRAHEDFKAVAEGDPTDAHAWYKVAETLFDDSPEGPRPAGPSKLDEKIHLLTKALAANPYLVSALHQLHLSYAQKGEREKQRTLIAAWKKLNPGTSPAAPGEPIGNAYGEVGRYASAIDPLPARPSPTSDDRPARFDATRAIEVKLADGDRWSRQSDFTGPLAVIARARARFGAAVAAFDADGDGKTDLYLAGAVVGPKGVRDALLLNKGEGRFVDATAARRLPLDRVSLGVAASDFDADRRVDLFLTGVGNNRLLRNLGDDGFTDITKAAGIAGPPAISPTARWIDIDQDGDLDLYVLNYASAEHANAAFTEAPPPGLANAVYRNDGKPPAAKNRPEDNWAPLATAPSDLPTTSGLSLVLTPWTEATELAGGAGRHTGIAVLDLDDDRDIDLVLSRDGDAPLALLNGRLGVFKGQVVAGLPADPVNGLLAADFDKDGLVDLAAVGQGGNVSAWRNTTARAVEGAKVTFNPIPSNATGWRSAAVADLDLDTWSDLVGLPASATPAPPAWARNLGTKLVSAPIPVAPDGEAATVGLALVDLLGDALPDLVVVRDGEAPRLAKNLGNGRRWIGLALGGRWKTSFDHMRTNSEGIGTRIAIEGEGLDVEYSYTTPDSGPAQSATPIVLGLGAAKEVTLLHLRWPDGVLQCELNLPVDTTHAIAEYNRKTGSCPVLFTWNGERFVCIGDFLGGGGLGYLVAPGLYGQPDRDESVAIAPDQLKAVGGVYRLSVSEPMDEIAYLDRLTLDVIDRPPGVSTTPDERFAPVGPRPTGATIAWTQTIAPVKVTDQSGADVTAALARWDRLTADGFRRLRGWIGYAEDHAITLDFGDRLAGFGPADPLVLCLAGWVEYPYSQTNYAAATTGTRLTPPVIERLQADGTWTVVVPDPGYPAGMPRRMTVDLTGKVGGPKCVLRIRTNMECYWDEAFVAVRDDRSGVRTSSLPVARATLGYRGYTREVSPDGRLPLLYDYEYVDPAPLARLAGNLTRFGDVAALLGEDDDRLCLVGPGDEVRLEFDVASLPVLAEGWTRAFVLKAVGYCKDADPFTATSDRVGPLPWRGMPDFPFKDDATRPIDPAYRRYLDEYQTRPAATR